MKNKKRVLMVINSPLVNAGVPNVVMNIVRNLCNEFIFDVITYSNDKGYFEEEFLSYGGKIYPVSLIEYSENRIMYGLRGIMLQKAVKKILIENNYDIIHCHNGDESGPCLKVAYECGVKIRISHAHGQYKAWSRNPIRIAYFKECLYLIKKYANVRLACSGLAGDSLFSNQLFDNVLNPIDYDYFHSIRKKEHEGINLLQIGYFGMVKNQLFSLEVMHSLQKRKRNIKLYLIGYNLKGEENYFEKMKEKIQEYNLSENVIFLPSDIEKNQCLDIIDFVLLPSKSEGLSIVAMEAQAAEIPCLLSRGVPKDVDFGLVKYIEEDAEKWADAIWENRMKQTTLNIKLQDYDIKKYSSQIGDYYNCVQ